MIHTAKEFIKSKSEEYKIDRDLVEDMLIDFAKLHVEAALKEASEKKLHTEFINGKEVVYVDVRSILKAYPLTNIK